MRKYRFLIIFILIVLLGIGSVGIYFAKIKPRRDLMSGISIQPVRPFSLAGIMQVISKFSYNSITNKINSDGVDIKGSAMRPKYKNGEYYAVDREYYTNRVPEREEVIVLKNPALSSDVELVRRIVGLPGEKIEIKEGKLFINGNIIPEPYLASNTSTNVSKEDFIKPSQEITIPTDQYLLLGDNRDGSLDSRQWGFISKNQILGKVLECVSNCSNDIVEKDDTIKFVPGEAIVTFEDNTTYKQARELFSSLGITEYENSYWVTTNKQVDDMTKLSKIDIFTIKVAPGTEKEIVNRLNKEPIVRVASTNDIL